MNEAEREHQYLLSCDIGNLDLVKKHLKEGVNVLSQGRANLNGVELAASNGHIEVFKHLLEVQQVREGDLSNLRLVQAIGGAIENGHMDIVKHACDYTAQKYSESYSEYLKDTGLGEGIKHGNNEVVDYFLEQGAYINSAFISPLQTAAEYGHAHTIKHLIERGADTNGSSCKTALEMAIDKRQTEAAIELMPYIEDLGAHIHKAARMGCTEIVEAMLDRGVDIERVNNVREETETPLTCAARYGRLEIVDLLISRGANMNPKEGCPLVEAVYNSQNNTIDCLLVKHGMEVRKESIEKIEGLKSNPYSMASVVETAERTLNIISKRDMKNSLEEKLAPAIDKPKAKNKTMKI